MRFNRVLRAVLWASVVAAPLSANGDRLTCEQTQYYAGDRVACTFIREDAPSAESVEITWSIFGKDLKRERCLRGASPLTIQAPQSLRAVTPLQLRVVWKDRQNAEQTLETRVQIYPRNPRYWKNAGEFSGKRIAVWDPTHQVDRGLDELEIVHDSLGTANTKGFKRFDLFIVGAPALSNPQELAAVIERSRQTMILETVFKDQPVARGALVQSLRKALAPY